MHRLTGVPTVDPRCIRRRPSHSVPQIQMPAKDNDPKAPTSPAKKIAKATTRKTTAKAPIEAKPGEESSAAPKRSRSVRRPKAVTAATETTSLEIGDSSSSAASTERDGDSRMSIEEAVRLRAYHLYAERGYHGGSAESDWFRAEREVAHGRQA